MVYQSLDVRRLAEGDCFVVPGEGDFWGFAAVDFECPAEDLGVTVGLGVCFFCLDERPRLVTTFRLASWKTVKVVADDAVVVISWPSEHRVSKSFPGFTINIQDCEVEVDRHDSATG